MHASRFSTSMRLAYSPCSDHTSRPPRLATLAAAVIITTARVLAASEIESKLTQATVCLMRISSTIESGHQDRHLLHRPEVDQAAGGERSRFSSGMAAYPEHIVELTCSSTTRARWLLVLYLGHSDGSEIYMKTDYRCGHIFSREGVRASQAIY